MKIKLKDVKIKHYVWIDDAVSVIVGFNSLTQTMCLIFMARDKLGLCLNWLYLRPGQWNRFCITSQLSMDNKLHNMKRKKDKIKNWFHRNLTTQSFFHILVNMVLINHLLFYKKRIRNLTKLRKQKIRNK